MKKFLKYFLNVLFLVLVFSAAVSVVSFVYCKVKKYDIPQIGSYKFMAVLSGSMKPEFDTYDLIAVKTVPSSSLKKGDIITFRSGKDLITHRISDIEYKNGKVQFKTRGDANNAEDENYVDSSDLVGKYVLSIPYGGIVASKLRSPVVLMILFTFIVYGLYTEFQKRNNSRKKSNENIDTLQK